MNIVFFVTLLFTLQLFYWWIGRHFSADSHGDNDYYLAGKSVTFFPLMMTFLATMLGGGVMLGAAEEAMLYGWPVLLYPLGAALGLILLGSGIGRKLASFNVTTVAEILEVIYKSPLLRKVASLLSMISLFMILVAQIIASSKFLVSLGVDSRLIFVAFWGIVILYTSRGGIRAVISTDLVQAAFFTAVLVFTILFVLGTHPAALSVPMPTLENFSAVSSKLYGWLFMPLLFIIIEQDIGQRCFAGSSPRVVSQAAFWAGIILMIVCVVPVYFGTLANVISLEVPPGGSVLMSVIEATTNSWIMALVGCAVLAAIISTATSLINSISSNIVSDFALLHFKKLNVRKPEEWITAVISIAAMICAFYFDNIVSILIQSFELSVSCLLVVTTMALFKRQGHAWQAFVSIFFGAAGFVLFRFYPIFLPQELASILLSLLGYYLVEGILYFQGDVKDALCREVSTE